MGIGNEVSIFVSACLSGVVIVAVYSVIRIFRRLRKHTLLWISIEDFLYWVWCTVYLFAEMHRTCSGRIRWYFVIGVSVGGGFFAAIFQKFLKKRIDKSKKTR